MDGIARGRHGRAWSLLEICAGGIIALDIDDPHVVADLSAEWVPWISHPLKPLPGGTPWDQEDRRGSALPVNPRGCRVNPGRCRGSYSMRRWIGEAVDLWVAADLILELGLLDQPSP